MPSSVEDSIDPELKELVTEHEARDVTAFKRGLQQELESKTSDLSASFRRIDHLAAENIELRLLVSRLQDQDAQSKKKEQILQDSLKSASSRISFLQQQADVLSTDNADLKPLLHRAQKAEELLQQKDMTNQTIICEQRSTRDHLEKTVDDLKQQLAVAAVDKLRQRELIDDLHKKVDICDAGQQTQTVGQLQRQPTRDYMHEMVAELRHQLVNSATERGKSDVLTLATVESDLHSTMNVRQSLEERVTELQRICDSMETMLVTEHGGYGDVYEDEVSGCLDASCTSVGCQPDPVSPGHEVTVVIITRNSEGLPCRGASLMDFKVSTVGPVSHLNPVSGSRSCFSTSFIPEEAGRCGVTVVFKGVATTCTTSCVSASHPFDCRQTAIMLSPNPVQVGGCVTGTVIAKNTLGLVTASPATAEFSLESIGTSTSLSPLHVVPGIPSQTSFTFVAGESGTAGVQLKYGSFTKSASVAVVGVVTPPISTMHTVVSCSPDPAEVGERVTVLLTTRSKLGVPTAGASLEDLRDLSPVGSSTQLLPFETLCPSTFKSSFVALEPGAAGIAMSFMGLVLYVTTQVMRGDTHIPRATISCERRTSTVGIPVELLITSRDHKNTPCPCHSESMWSLCADPEAIAILSMEKISCCTLRAEVVPLGPVGRHCIELLFCNDVVSRINVGVEKSSRWIPEKTQLLIREHTGQDVTQYSKSVSRAEELLFVSASNRALLVITTFSQHGPAVGPPADAFVVSGCDATPVIEVSPGVYQSEISGFQPGIAEVRVDVESFSLLRTLRVVEPSREADPTMTTVTCRPNTVLVGDTVSAVISFFDSSGVPAHAPSAAAILLEPVGNISKLTRVARNEPSSSTFEVVFGCKEEGTAGLLVGHSCCTIRSSVTVSSLDSMESGLMCLPRTDVALLPDTVQSGQQVKCLITLRDSRSAPLFEAETPPVTVLIRPLQNIVHVSKVSVLPGCSSTWLASFTAGPGTGDAVIEVTINGESFIASATVEHKLFDDFDGELHRLRELTSRLQAATDLFSAERRGNHQVHPLQLIAGENHFTRPASRTYFPHFGLELTDSIHFIGLGARFEYAGVKVVAARGASSLAGLLEGDIIVGVDKRQVAVLADFKDAVQDAVPGNVLSFSVLARGGHSEKTVLVTPKKSHLSADQRPSYTRTIRVSPADIGLPESGSLSVDLQPLSESPSTEDRFQQRSSPSNSYQGYSQGAFFGSA
ncbi:hypothetical protein DIPPA_52337 [Diplonema papillatum]|nr:hypothetical protein DIPPA_52337 [Diplonema papillatum]